MKRKLFVNFALSLLIVALLLPAARTQSQSAARYPAGSGYPAPTLTLFENEQQAQKHCPQDTIVWLNLPSGIISRVSDGRPTPTTALSSVRKRTLAGDRATLNQPFTFCCGQRA